jgi:transposase InsO family protein
MAYRFMQAHQDQYTIREMAGVFGVSRSASYRWTRDGVSEGRRKADADLVHLIREIATRHHQRYGILRVREELRRVYGKRVSRKKVARLMREHGLNARRRRKFIPTTNSNHALEP